LTAEELDRGASAAADEGFRLCHMLQVWKRTFASDDGTSTALPNRNKASPEMLLCQVFFSGVSIYLSGIFDYEIYHWQSRDIPVPTIPEATIQEHFQTIITLTDFSLDTTTLSPLLFLFPLRIAGARSYTQDQRDAVLLLLDRIGCDFAVTRIFAVELGQFWHDRDAHLVL
jgi:hypothetical protein